MLCLYCSKGGAVAEGCVYRRGGGAHGRGGFAEQDEREEGERVEERDG